MDDTGRVLAQIDRLFVQLEILQTTTNDNRGQITHVLDLIQGNGEKPGLLEEVREIRRTQTDMLERNNKQDDKLEEHEHRLNNLKMVVIVISVIVVIIIIIVLILLSSQPQATAALLNMLQ